MSYPKIGEISKYKPSKGRCAICNETGANNKVTIEVSIMRGDDRVIRVHQNCIRQLSDKDILEKIKGSIWYAETVIK